MERSQPHHHRGRGRGRGRGSGRINPNSSSSSSSSPSSRNSNKNPSLNTKTLNQKYNTKELPNNNNNTSSGPRNNNDYHEDEFSPITGICPFMCPVAEREQRERLRDLAVFERLDGNRGKSSSNLAVKKFCRTISSKDVQASDVRPLPVLEDTLNYLFNLLNSIQIPFEVIHDFIFDRTRSIRQDLSMQNIVGDRAVLMYERMVKFHVISHHKLKQHGNGNPDISPMYHLNMEQLTKALSSLYNLYKENRNSHSSICENEAEFRSFYVLLRLGSENQPMGESLSLWFRHVPSSILKSKEMSFARIILRYFRMGNYKRFICTTEAEASYLQYCIIEPYMNEVRALALSCLNYGGYKLHSYPLADLSKLLLMKEADVESLCSDCGLEMITDEDRNRWLPAKQTGFCNPKGKFKKSYQVVSERLERESAECEKLLWLQNRDVQSSRYTEKMI